MLSYWDNSRVIAAVEEELYSVFNAENADNTEQDWSEISPLESTIVIVKRHITRVTRQVHMRPYLELVEIVFELIWVSLYR